MIELALKPQHKLLAHIIRSANRRARHRLRIGRRHAPLKVTPALGLRGYVFPVAGGATFGDSYGAFRADVSGNWHHGDDIFAPIGTPVVAVANGTLNRVGWEPIGGWRLWVRDDRRNEFYYAHLSGYSPLAVAGKPVHKGEVLGFVGNTGDAFTTTPHLHFEIHPHQLLALDYDGAVDPTNYLDHWQRRNHVNAPRPVVSSLPHGAAAHEAKFVFGELLAARGFTRHAPTVAPKIHLAAVDRFAQPIRDVAAMPAPLSHGSSSKSSLLVALAAAFASIALVALIVGSGRRFVHRQNR